MKLTLETDRLILRPFELDDAKSMFNNWASDDEVTKYLTWNTHKSIEETKEILAFWVNQYEKEERINFAIVYKENNELIGGIDVVGYLEGVPVIGYNLSRKYWNKGIMTEACKKVIELLNGVNLQHITLHPRTGVQQYKGSIDGERLKEACRISKNPIIYNGDILTLDDIKRIEDNYPQIKGVMIGRGLLGAPSLAQEYNSGETWSNARRIELMLRMHDALMAEYSKILKGDVQMLNKMRTFWEYSEPLLGRKPYKKIMKSGNLKNYLNAVNELNIL